MKRIFCVAVLLLLSCFLILPTAADTITISGAYYDGDIMAGVMSATYHYSLVQGAGSTGYKETVPLKTPSYSMNLDQLYPYLRYGHLGNLQGQSKTYFYAFDCDTLNFPGKKVKSLSLPVCFGMGSYGSIDTNGGFIARLTVDGKEVGDYFKLSYLSDYDIDGSGIPGCNVFGGVINYTFPAPVDVVRIGVHVIRGDNDSRPYAGNSFLIGVGKLYYEYVSAETQDIVTPEQQGALDDMSKDIAQAEQDNAELSKALDQVSYPEDGFDDAPVNDVLTQTDSITGNLTFRAFIEFLWQLPNVMTGGLCAIALATVRFLMTRT